MKKERKKTMNNDENDRTKQCKMMKTGERKET